MRFLLLLLILPGCATAINGTTQKLIVTTEPAGAVCEVRRGINLLVADRTTPFELDVRRGSGPLGVFCIRSGYVDRAQFFEAERSAAGLGNILLGGAVGVAVDGATGANFGYPEVLHVRLTPRRFESAAQRSAYFETERAQLRAAHAERIRPFQSATTCQTIGETQCARGIAQADRRLATELAEVETRMGSTTSGGP